jgi:hypothetical protein
MESTAHEDALLEAFRTRQRSDLEVAIDVEDRLLRLKATMDHTWWDEIVGYRETLVRTAAGALTPPFRRTTAVGEYDATAETIVNEVYGSARYNAPELCRLSPDRRRRWLLNRTLERVDHVLRGTRASSPVPGLMERP